MPIHSIYTYIWWIQHSLFFLFGHVFHLFFSSLPSSNCPKQLLSLISPCLVSHNICLWNEELCVAPWIFIPPFINNVAHIHQKISLSVPRLSSIALFSTGLQKSTFFLYMSINGECQSRDHKIWGDKFRHTHMHFQGQSQPEFMQWLELIA